MRQMAYLAVCLWAAVGLTSRASLVCGGRKATTLAFKSTAFKLASTRDASAWDSMIYSFSHKRTGLKVHIMVRDDAVDRAISFLASVPTKPKDNKGIAHVLEHAVMRGTKKMPYQDAWRHLKYGSTGIYYDTQTTDSATSYLFSTYRKQDFANLLEFHVDHLYNSSIVDDDTSIAMESWLWAPLSSDGNAVRVGTVLNEMRAMRASPANIAQIAVGSALFSDTFHKFHGRGMPADIVDIKTADVRDFYKANYHPGKTELYIYTSAPQADVTKWLDIIDKQVHDYTGKPKDTEISPPCAYPQYKEHIDDVIVPVGVPKMIKGGVFYVAWALEFWRNGVLETLSVKERMAFSLIYFNLTYGTKGPIAQALNKSGIRAYMLTPGSHYSAGASKITFSIIMDDMHGEGTDSTDALRLTPEMKKTIEGKLRLVQEVIIGEYRKVAAGNFDKERFMDTVNIYVWQRSSWTEPSFPAGLAFILGLRQADMQQRSWDDQINELKYVRELQDDMKAGSKIMEELADRLIVNNKHVARVAVLPSLILGDQEAAADEVAWQALSKQERSAIITRTQAIVGKEAALRNPAMCTNVPWIRATDLESDIKPALLPCKYWQIELSELAKENKLAYPWAGKGTRNLWDNHVPIVYFDSTKDKLTYIQLSWFLPQLGAADIRWLDLLLRIVHSHDGATDSVTSTVRKIPKLTGAVTMDISSLSLPRAPNYVSWPHDADIRASMTFSTTDEKMTPLASVMKEVIYNTDLDCPAFALEVARAGRVLGTEKYNHRLASTVSAVHTKSSQAASWLQAALFGPEAYDHYAEIEKIVEQDWPAALKKLQDIRSKAFRTENLVVTVAGNPLKSNTPPKSLVTLVRNVATGADINEAKVKVGSVITSRANINNLIRERATLGATNDWNTVPPKMDGPETLSQGVWVKEMLESGDVTLRPNHINAVLVSADWNTNLLKIRLQEPGEPVMASLRVISRWISAYWITKRMRRVNRIYSGAVEYDIQGQLNMLTWGDPNVSSTIDEFLGVATGYRKGLPGDTYDGLEEMSDRQAEQAAVTLVDFDEAPWPKSAAPRAGLEAILLGTTEESFLARRKEALRTTPADYKKLQEITRRALLHGRRLQTHGIPSAKLSDARKEIERNIGSEDPTLKPEFRIHGAEETIPVRTVMESTAGGSAQ